MRIIWRFIGSLLIIIGTSLCLLIVLELSLRIFSPKYQKMASAPLAQSALRLHTRKPDTDLLFYNPDGRYVYQVHFNNAGMAHTEDIDAANLEQYTTVGLFGDDNVENSSLEREASLVVRLQKLLNQTQPHFRVLNFGVAGYGIDQSYLYYSHSPLKTKLNYVLYFLGPEQLRYLHRNSLYSLDKSNSLQLNPLPVRRPILSRLARLHTSYLLIDLWNIWYPDHPISGSTNYYNRVVQLELNHLAVQRDSSKASLALQTALQSGEETPELQQSIAVGRALLQRWSEEAETAGSRFIVVVPPWENRQILTKLLPEHIPVFDLTKRPQQIHSEMLPEDDVPLLHASHPWGRAEIEHVAQVLVQYLQSKLPDTTP